ncbi:GTP pyrophosphokinase family protein [Streptomyces zaomyceticus]|uniref:GTP pyrophosphokinase n=1 Tax=Streptomyces zaomyceticus TaxID=68286 RepID=UPI00371F95F6
MSLIDEFMSRYAKEYDFYSQAARLSAQILERNLQTSGIRCIVTSRAKDPSRLAAKCRQRNQRAPYESIEKIYDDIVDLAGVRVALYFPGQQEQVDGIVKRIFRLMEPRKNFPAEGQRGTGKRFSGYSATHYRVQIQERELSEPDIRYASARIEIQVASVLMHAWSEVEHDLIYKPLNGDLSDQERSILDQLNGLVIAGELALQLLQQAGESRVTDTERPFLNHYDLAALLHSHATGLISGPVAESGLGRVDLLFELLTRLNLATPSLLAPYLQSLHGNLERRPLADQIIDALLLENASRYDDFNGITSDDHESRSGTQGNSRDRRHRAAGEFLSKWVEVEQELRRLAPDDDRNVALISLPRLIARIPQIDEGLKREIQGLRVLRNNLVHHDGNLVENGMLRQAIDQLGEIKERLSRM